MSTYYNCNCKNCMFAESASLLRSASFDNVDLTVTVHSETNKHGTFQHTAKLNILKWPKNSVFLIIYMSSVTDDSSPLGCNTAPLSEWFPFQRNCLHFQVLNGPSCPFSHHIPEHWNPHNFHVSCYRVTTAGPSFSSHLLLLWIPWGLIKLVLALIRWVLPELGQCLVICIVSTFKCKSHPQRH